MVPAAVVTLDALPLTATGKVDRTQLTNPFFDRDLCDAPRTDLERAVAAVWCEVLGVPRVGIHDDVIACGGSSLQGLRLVARLQHPGIVTVFDYGTLPDGAAYLVMEYVRGEDLRSLLKREQLLAPADAIQLVNAVAAGIDYAHRAGVLHRDLKPENVLLPASGIGPKVLDFGVATIADSEGTELQTLTHRGTIVGTPSYMAPEQLRGERVDERADVYSLGVMTYEILTGRLPFGAGSLVEIGIKQADLSGQLDVTGVPPPLLPILMQTLSLARDDRPPSAAAFANALGALSVH